MKKNKSFLNIIWATAVAFLASSSFAKEIIKPVFHKDGTEYSSYTEDYSPAEQGDPTNIGAWSYNQIDEGEINKNNGSGWVTHTADGKYAVYVGPAWTNSHPSFGTHYNTTEFTGNYVKNKVTSVSFETRVLNDLIFPRARPITIALRGPDGFTLYKTTGTCVYINGDYCPQAAPLPKVWTHYEFKIPHTYKDAEWAGWEIYNLKDHDVKYKFKDYFDKVITNVQKVDFIFGTPALVYGLQPFEIESTIPTIVKEVSK